MIEENFIQTFNPFAERQIEPNVPLNQDGYYAEDVFGKRRFSVTRKRIREYLDYLSATRDFITVFRLSLYIINYSLFRWPGRVLGAVGFVFYAAATCYNIYEMIEGSKSASPFKKFISIVEGSLDIVTCAAGYICLFAGASTWVIASMFTLNYLVGVGSAALKLQKLKADEEKENLDDESIEQNKTLKLLYQYKREAYTRDLALSATATFLLITWYIIPGSTAVVALGYIALLFTYKYQDKWKKNQRIKLSQLAEKPLVEPVGLDTQVSTGLKKLMTRLNVSKTSADKKRANDVEGEDCVQSRAYKASVTGAQQRRGSYTSMEPDPAIMLDMADAIRAH